MSSDKVKETAFELSKLGCIGYSGWFGLRSCHKRLMRKLEKILRESRGGDVIEAYTVLVTDTILDSWVMRIGDEEARREVEAEVRKILEYFLSRA